VVRALTDHRSEARSDARLVALVRGGDERAAVELFDRYAPLARRLLVRSLGPSEETGDLVQEVFIAVVQGLGELHDPSALRSFVYGVAVNTARMALRKRYRRRFVVFGREPDVEPSVPPAAHESLRAVARLYELFAELGEEPRTLFVLRYMEELSLPEIASILGWGLTKTKRRLERARALFAARARRVPELEPYLRSDDLPGDDEEASHG
jgi:RNA polymerase sigma-70 factor (ECF subfamily)